MIRGAKSTKRTAFHAALGESKNNIVLLEVA
jgi:hypothetical protein